MVVTYRCCVFVFFHLKQSGNHVVYLFKTLQSFNTFSVGKTLSNQLVACCLVALYGAIGPHLWFVRFVDMGGWSPVMGVEVCGYGVMVTKRGVCLLISSNSVFRLPLMGRFEGPHSWVCGTFDCDGGA